MPSMIMINNGIRKHHVTITHIVIKAAGECLKAGWKTVNGKIVFGRFVPYDTVDVTCLMDVDNGRDLAAVLVEEVDKKSFEDISDFLATR